MTSASQPPEPGRPIPSTDNTGSTGSTHPTPAASDLLGQALDQLRERPTPRVVEVGDAVLRRTLAAPRRAVLVHARAPHDFVRVSSTAIITVLRERIDAGLTAAAVGRIGLDVSREGSLDQLTVELFVQYGADILVLADEARALALSTLAGLLGPDGPTVHVTVSHVHVSDVTVGDPHLVDPGEE